MTIEFSEQVAVVTGAASGLGLAIARKLHSEGAAVALLDLNEAALSQATKDFGDKAFAIALNLTNETDVDSVINQIGERFGRIDILVNSAGVTGQTNIKTHEVTTEDLRL